MPKHGRSSIREILCRFGDSEKVQSAVFANFFTGRWMGSASSHYATQKQVLAQLKLDEADPNALRWLNNAIASVDRISRWRRLKRKHGDFSLAATKSRGKMACLVRYIPLRYPPRHKSGREGDRFIDFV